METFDMLPPVQSFHQSHNCLVNWMNGMRASFSLSLENQKYFVWRNKLVAISATILSSLPPMKRQETSHWIRNKVTSSRSGHWLAGSRDWHFHLPTARLSLDEKQGHLFAQWPLATPGHTFTFLHSSTPKQQGSNTWCQAHPPPLYLCRGGGRVHHHRSTFPPPPLHLPSPWIVITSYNLKEDFATDKRLKDINSL